MSCKSTILLLPCVHIFDDVIDNTLCIDVNYGVVDDFSCIEVGNDSEFARLMRYLLKDNTQAEILEVIKGVE